MITADERTSRRSTTSEPPAPLTADVGRSLTTRLVIRVVAVVLLVLLGYTVVSHRQRRALLEEGTREQAALLAAVLQRSADDLLGRDNPEALDRLLQRALQQDGIFAALVLTRDRVMAGGATELQCLITSLPRPLTGRQQAGRARCGTGVLWTAEPVAGGAATLVVAIEEILINEAVASALRRQLLLALALTGATALVTLVVLRTSLSHPLATIMSAVRALPVTGAAPPMELDRSPREMTQLANLLTKATAELESRRAELLERAEEKARFEQQLARTQKFAMIGRLSGGLAHELGSPLGVIGLRARAICERTHEPAVVTEAEAIEREVERMTTFIQGLLHISRSQGIALRELEVNALLREVVADQSSRAATAGVQLRLHGQPDDVVIEGNRILLRHALNNVIRNAIQALDENEGGGDTVDIRVVADPVEVEILIEDNGPGIRPEELGKVFEPFHTTRVSSQGTGLGLPVSRGIVEEHRGSMRLENRSEGGLRVSIILPRDTTGDPSGAAA
jgi:two-component system, NtrC family, sensor kinase